MWELILSAPIYCYLIAAAFIAITIISIERDGYIFAMAWAAIGYVAVTYLLVGQENLIKSLQSIPYHWPWVLGYILLGLAWSVLKWGIFVRRQVKMLATKIASVKKNCKDTIEKIEKDGGERYKTSEQKENGKSAMLANSIGQMTDIIYDAISTFSDAPASYDIRKIIENKGLFEVSSNDIMSKIKFTPTKEKSRISAWIALWPFSAIGTLVSDWLINFFDYIVEALREIYNSITRMIVKSAFDDAMK